MNDEVDAGAPTGDSLQPAESQPSTQPAANQPTEGETQANLFGVTGPYDGQPLTRGGNQANLFAVTGPYDGQPLTKEAKPQPGLVLGQEPDSPSEEQGQ